MGMFQRGIIIYIESQKQLNDNERESFKQQVSQVELNFKQLHVGTIQVILSKLLQICFVYNL